MIYERPTKGIASDMFMNVLSGGGGAFISGACGKDHTIDNVTDEEFESGDYESIGYSELNGLFFVYGCVECNERLSRYEQFIWDNRNVIRDYLKIRIDQEKKWADEEHLLNVLSGIS